MKPEIVKPHDQRADDVVAGINICLRVVDIYIYV